MQQLVLLFLVALLLDGALCRDDDHPWSDVNQPFYEIKSGLSIPLVGYGIGNLPHAEIPYVIHDQLRRGVLLVDTAHASNNERLIAEAVAKYDGGGIQTRGGSGSRAHAEELAPLHVVTKVWYTHLGYERTKLSIRESLENLSSTSPRQIYVHMLLHWPRCDDDIEWMNCEEEEHRLPQSVKDAGPPPHLDKANAFKHSWKAMEEVYAEHQNEMLKRSQMDKITKGREEVMKSVNSKDVTPIVASIGVSNFDLEDLKELMLARHPPLIYQGSSWTAFYDPHLTSYIREHHIFYQSYAVMSILHRRDQAPNAYRVLSDLAQDLRATVHPEDKEADLTEATVVLAYFLHKDVGVVPRAASPSHQRENSPPAVAAILPHLTVSLLEQLERAITSLLRGEDLHISVAFTNALQLPIQIHWVHPETSEEHLVSNVIQPGNVEVQKTHPGHKFVAYDPERAIRREFVVDAAYGEHLSFAVEL